MRLPFDILIIDLELNHPNEPDKTEIIELGGIKLLRDGRLGGSFTALIKPTNPLSHFPTYELQDRIIELTGITNEAINTEGISLQDAMSNFTSFAKSGSSNIVLGAWGNDVQFLKGVCKDRGIPYDFRHSFIECKSIAIFVNAMMNKKPAKGLASHLHGRGMPFDTLYGKQHRALADAYNTALLLKSLISDIDAIKNSIRDLSILLDSK